MTWTPLNLYNKTCKQDWNVQMRETKQNCYYLFYKLLLLPIWTTYYYIKQLSISSSGCTHSPRHNCIHAADNVGVYIIGMYSDCMYLQLLWNAQHGLAFSSLLYNARWGCVSVSRYASMHNENTILLSGLMITLKDGKDFFGVCFSLLVQCSFCLAAVLLGTAIVQYVH